MQKINVLAISGSTKKKSTSFFILKQIQKNYKDNLTVTIYDRIANLPHFNPDLDKSPLPKSVSELQELIKNADAVLICTPEYVFSMPGSLKNLLEWNVSTTLFSGKVTAMIVAAAIGKKAFESLALVLTTIEAVIPDTNKLLIQGAKGKVNEHGEITDIQTLALINKLVDSIRESVTSIEKTPSKFT